MGWVEAALQVQLLRLRRGSRMGTRHGAIQVKHLGGDGRRQGWVVIQGAL
jgi:hypothetical protein